ncbi:WD40 repeat domain-containing protein [Streptomyces sp. CRN 30]|uniref:WD40 repeat domain-containing protein n=1 Tax=Streptomyces sp. CRN 30 TaxID=3075613 RepID=UPI002A832530|nr:WD40 repeat domain-containing protein [Streptomyces sp. CRN 30]
MRRRSLPLFAGLAGLLLAAAQAAPAVADAEAFTIEDPRITESSGLAASRQHPGIYWTHNDSDDGAFLYAVDSATGKTVATVTMSGVGAPRDVEAISIGPGNELYVGDIGDNLGGTWDHVWIYRLPEPKELQDQTVRATQYVVQYADGARDAESLMVHPKTGRVYVVDKKKAGGALYEGPATLSASGVNVFEEIAAVDLWATDAAFSPDGEQLAVRGYFGGTAFDWNGGKIKETGRLSVPLQRQGESMTYTPDGTQIMYGSEGSGSSVEPRPAPAAGGGAKEPSGGGSAQTGEDAGDDAGSTKNVQVGVVAVAAVIVVLWGVRRLRRAR